MAKFALLFATLFFAGAIGEVVKTKLKIIPAAIVTEVPAVTPYESHSKLVFRVSLPTYEARTILDPANGTEVPCRNDDIICNTRRLTSMVLDDYESRIIEAQFLNRYRQKRQLGIILGAGMAFAGGYIVHSVESRLSSSLFGEQRDIENQVHNLKKTVRETQRAILISEANVTKFANGITAAVEGIRVEVQRLVFDRQLEKLEMLTLQKYLFSKLERDWFSESLLACTQNTIPIKMISTGILRSELEKLNEKVRSDGKTLAMGIIDISSYYKLPIVDCFFSKTQATIIINVPINRLDENWRIFEIFHTKFAYNNQVCELYPQDAKYLAIGNSKSVLIDSHMERHCRITENRLCLIPQFTRDSSQSINCAVGMLKNKPVGELAKVCAFRCSTNSELIINQLDEKTLLITNVVSMNVTCPGKVEEYLFNKTGAVEVHMRCNCTIILDGNMVIPPPFYCTPEDANTEYVIRTSPNLWSSLDAAIGSSAQYFTDHSKYTFNPLWPRMLPVLNLTSSFSSLPYDENESEISSETIWLVILSLLIVVNSLLVGYLMCAVLRY